MVIQKIYWDNIPEYCKHCKRGERPVEEKRYRPDGSWDLYTGWGYVNKNGVIVFVDNGPYGKHSHTVYRADGKLVGYRDEGSGEGDWNDALWKETRCKKCAGTFKYHVEWNHIPNLCAQCRNNEPRLADHIETGIHGEITAETVALDQFNFQQTEYEPPYQGIDRIYRDGDSLVIIEAKSVSGYPPSALHNTANGKQMAESWILLQAKAMKASSYQSNQVLGDEILARLNNDRKSSIRRILINTDPQTGIVRCFECFDWQTDLWLEIDPFDD